MKFRPAQHLKSNKGFTLIELLVVIGILAILLSIVLIAINPARQFGQANDTKRQSAVTQILNAVGAYHADNRGLLPPSLPASGSGTISSTDVDLCDDIVGIYIPALPVDPSIPGAADITDCNSAYDTGYDIAVDANGRVTVSAPNADITTPIQVTR